MVFRAQLYRWRWFLLAAAVLLLLAIASTFVTLPLRDSDKAKAAQNLVAWIVEGRSVPGFGEEYPDAQWMPEKKKFFVICDFLPADVLLSDDPRVQRITSQDYKAVFQKQRYDGADYIFIELKSVSESELVLEFCNAF